MLKLLPIALAVTLTGCGTEAPAPAEAEAAQSLSAGLYELNAEVTAIHSTDQTTPATAMKVGDKGVTKACVLADGKPDPALLAEAASDKCTIKNSYIRGGRMSAQMSCQREGARGEVMPAMMGSFKSDSFEGEITTHTYFIADGDYRLTRKISAKRVGDCPAAGAEKAAS
ncbi:MAG TPA: DUF3617 family protein [Sphingomicrobium sp.]|nr:DUF3617 family protein [Sphingomicrobium sp.]